jgi:hypothetical protein
MSHNIDISQNSTQALNIGCFKETLHHSNIYCMK